MPSDKRKPRYERSYVNKIRDQVIAILREKHPDIDSGEITNTAIRTALGWRSVHELPQGPTGPWVPLSPAHQAENIARYLPRNLKKELSTRTPSPPRPDRRVLDSAHGIAYALVIELWDDAFRTEVVNRCRQHYWGEASPPFPWLTSEGKSQRQEAFNSAQLWLEQQAQSEGGGPMRLTVELQVPRVAITRRALQGVIDTAAQKRFWRTSGTTALAPAGLLITPLSAEFDTLGVEIKGWQLGTERLAKLELKWQGRELELREGHLHAVPVVEGGALEQLYQACDRLAQIRGWSASQAAAFILMDEPPKPPPFDLGERGGARRPKPLSFDHIALLQLFYMTPDASWPQRLHVWDTWRAAYPEEKLKLTFRREPKPGLPGFPTTDRQRATWITTETRRAANRALNLLALSGAP